MRTPIFIGHCRIQLDFSFFALLAFFCLFGRTGSGAALLAAVLLHELFHVVFLRLFHTPPVLLELSGLGCRMVVPPENGMRFGQKAWVSLAGPVGNLLVFGVAALLGASQRPFALSNFALGILHLLPIEPLDGGLALRAILERRLGPVRGGRIAFFVSLIVLLPLSVLGFLVLLRSRNNFSLLLMCVYLMLYLVLKQKGMEL